MCPPDIVDAVAKLHKSRFILAFRAHAVLLKATARPSRDGRAVLWP